MMKKKTVRIIGFDLARSLAILGMVIVNYKIVLNAGEAGPEWLVATIGQLEGRAAALFVVLAGVGLSLLSAKSRRSGDLPAIRRDRIVILKRAVFLLIVGLTYTPIWPADILHFYGIYMALGALLLTSDNKVLMIWSGGFIALFLLMLFILDYNAGWDWNTLEYVDFWQPSGMIRHLFYNGFHPVFPWAAFLFAGLWLGRRDFSNHVFRKRLILGGAAVFILTAITSYLLQNAMTGTGGLSAEEAAAVFGLKPMPPNPFYMISAASLAFAVIGLCVEFGYDRSEAFYLKPFIRAGQLALTLYVAHVVVGFGVMEALGLFHDQSLAFALASALIFYLAGLVFSHLWASRYKKGPLEWIMRKATG